MSKKKQVIFQNSIPGKFIPRNTLPIGSGSQAYFRYQSFPPRANDNRFNAKMAELLASSSAINDGNEFVSTKSSQASVISTELASMNCSPIHSKLFHRRIVTMIEILRKPNDNNSSLPITSFQTEQKSQPITFGQLRQATISSTPITVVKDKTTLHPLNVNVEEKHQTISQSCIRDHTSDVTLITLKSSGKHQTNKERLYYSPSLEQLFEKQNTVSQTKTENDLQSQQSPLTVDEILTRYSSKVKSSTDTESHLTSTNDLDTTAFYIHPSTSQWNYFENNQQIVPPPQLVFSEQNRNRPPPPSYSASVVKTHRRTPTALEINPVQNLIQSSTSTSNLKHLYSGSLTTKHLFTENPSFVLQNSPAPFVLTLTNPTSNNSIRLPSPSYQPPPLLITNDSSTSNQQSKTSPIQSSGGFDREFSRLLYGKDARRTRQKKQKRKAFSDPVKKSIEEAIRSVEKSHRRVSTHLNKTDTTKEEEEEEDLDDEIPRTRSNNYRHSLSFLPRRRFQRQLNLMEHNYESTKSSIVSANPLLKQRIPSFLRVYSRASSSTDVLLQWNLFNLSELETFYGMMSRLYKNENLARVQLYEAYRSALLSALASRTSLNTDDESEAITTPL